MPDHEYLHENLITPWDFTGDFMMDLRQNLFTRAKRKLLLIAVWTEQQQAPSAHVWFAEVSAWQRKRRCFSVLGNHLPDSSAIKETLLS